MLKLATDLVGYSFRYGWTAPKSGSRSHVAAGSWAEHWARGLGAAAGLHQHQQLIPRSFGFKRV